MLSQLMPALITLEAIQTALCLGATLIVVHTLSDAYDTRDKVRARDYDEWALAWASNSIRGKWAFVAVEIFSLAMSIDRVGLLYRGYTPDYWSRWIAFGLGRTAMSVLVAWVAWINVSAFKGMRDEPGE
jgi:hypothetical protein